MVSHTCMHFEPIFQINHDYRVAGLKTGRCVDADKSPYGKVCEVYAWCPVEDDVLPMQGFNLRFLSCL